MLKRIANWSRRLRYPRIVIFGQYKTGTTDFFYLIRNSLKKPPRELFESTLWEPLADDHNRPLLAKVMVPPGPPFAQNTIEYEAGVQTFRTFDRQIYLLRDPRDWLVSGIMFLPQAYTPFYRDRYAVDKLLALLRNKEHDSRSVPMLDLLAVILEPGGQTVNDWLPSLITNHYDRLFRFEDGLGSHLRLRYEDFVSGRVEAAEHYLGFRLNGSSKPTLMFPEHWTPAYGSVG